jgi:Spherulation-specific family 4
MWQSYLTIVSPQCKIARLFTIVFKNHQGVKPPRNSPDNDDRMVKVNWILAMSMLVNCSSSCTITERSKQQIIDRNSNQSDPDRTQIVSNLDRPSKLKILLPLYIYPNWYDKNKYIWKQVTAAAKKVPIVAIINPNNGPDRAPPNADYQQGIRDLHQAGIKIIGYVPTNYAKRDLQAVKADIDLYIKHFNIEGIFLDEATSTQDKHSYYQQIYRYIKSQQSNNKSPQHDYTVIINPGVAVDEAYLSQPVADTVVILENYHKAWNKYTPPSYIKKYHPENFAALIHTTANRKFLKNTLDRVAKSKFGYVYVTNDSPDALDRNPWNSLPEYWQAEVNYIQQLNKID